MEIFGLLIAVPILLLIGFAILLPIIALIDIFNSKFQGNDNILMALIVLFIPLGAILYFFIAPSRKMKC